jgi:ATP-binding cassette subfamily F protein uup
MATPLLTLQNIAVTFGSAALLEDANLSIGSRERLCIVGRNGSGKSTLMKIAAGLLEPDGGERFLQPGTTVRYLAQEPDFGETRSVLAYVEAGLSPADDLYRAQYLVSELGLSGTEDPKTLSGGEARRAALARCLAPEPDILLLDEPTNHLDIHVIEWLERELQGLKSAIVLISHDRRFLSNMSRATLWVDRGRTRQIGIGFSGFEAWRDETLAQEELERHKLDRKIEREADWLRYGVTARRKRNVRRLAALHSMREERRNAVRQPAQVKLAAAEGQLSGKLVIEAKRIAKTFGDNAVVRDFSTRIARGDRIGLVGPNGAGKSTLVKMLTGQLSPDEGEVRLGANLELAHLDQGRESLNPEWTVADALTGGGGDLVVVNGQAKHVVAYMQDFLFSPEQVRTPLKVLSGGERARLMLARALAKPSNLLVLDEPTNDLDLETLDVLEEMLGDYTGTILLVSHDRDFLDRIVGSVIAPEGDGRWQEYAGGYSDMLTQRAGGGEAAKPQNETSEKPLQARGGKQTSPAPVAAAPKRRLSFKEKHALETLPDRIAALDRDIARHHLVLEDTSLYSRDPEAFQKAMDALAKAQAEKAAAEEQWLELEMLREELERERASAS